MLLKMDYNTLKNLIKEGKTGPRTVPLIDSIPYVKEWISSGHPTGTTPNSWLFVSHGTNKFGSKTDL